MNSQQHRRLLRVERAHEHFRALLLIVGLPPVGRSHTAWVKEVSDYYDSLHETGTYRNRNKFVRSYVRWCKHQINEQEQRDG